MDQRSVGGIYVPSFKTKALMVPPVGGSNLKIIPRSCMIGLTSLSIPIKLSFHFYK